MENNEYQTTSYVEYEKSPQETEKKTETTTSSIEEQYFDLPFKERMKIQNKHLKLKMKTKSQEFKAIAKVKSEEFRAKSKEIREKIREKNRHFHAKIEEHIAQEKQHQQSVVSQNQNALDNQLSEPTKYCPECGHEVSFSGRFCPACGATH